MNDATPLRAFLAVDLPAAIHDRLVALKRDLEAVRADVRWVRDNGLHATVKFLGSVAPARMDDARASLERALPALDPFEVRLHGVGAFPDPRRPRVLWVEIEGPGLPALAGMVEDALCTIGFPRETRPFRSHVTLGRVRGRRGWAKLEEALKSRREEDFGSCRVEGIAGFRSDLRPDGAVYTKLWTIPLGRSRD